MSGPRARRWSRFATGLLLITVAGLGIRVTYIALDSPETIPELSGDAVYYQMGANLLADGKGFIDPYRYTYGGREEITLPSGEQMVVVTPKGHIEPTAGHPPVYVAYLAVWSKLGFDSIRAHQLASALMGAASIVVAGLLGKALVGPRVGLITAGLTAVYANIWINDGLVMSETAAIFFAFVSTLVGLRFWRSPTMGNGVLFAVAAAFAALSRAELLLFLPIIGAAALIRAALPWRDRILRYAVMGVVGVAVVAPWVIRNNVVMEERVLLSDGAGTVMVQANCDDTYYGDNIGSWSLPCGNPQPYGPNGELLDESQRDVVVRQRATDYIADHKVRLATVVVPARVGRMWGLYDSLDQIRADVLEGRPAFAAWLGFWQYVVLAPTALVGVAIQWRRREPVLVIGLWAILATLTAAGAFGNTRYRTAAEVSIVVFAAVAIDALVRLVERRRGHDPEPTHPGPGRPTVVAV